MARIRTIKPEFPQSETMGRVSRDARLLFIQLWTIADDAGRTRGHSRVLASLLYPYDDDAKDLLPAWLDELDAGGAIRRYSVNGDTYLEICNWLKHQRIDKPSGPKCPAFEDGSRILASPPGGTGTTTTTTTTTGNGPSLSVSPTAGDGPQKAGEKKKPTDEPDIDPADVQLVFDHWKTVWGHPRAKLDKDRRKLIGKRLADYQADSLCQAISGYQHSPHHTGQNDRATVYDDIGLFLRDSAHVDAGLRFANQPLRTDQSALMRKNVAAIADWTPPEVRRAAN